MPPLLTNLQSLPTQKMANSIYFVILFSAMFFPASQCATFSQNEAFFSHSPPAIFVFGDSLSDTGNLMAAFPFLADAENPPYGSSFFHAPSGRFSDGRLIIDFMASKWDLPFLEPYFMNVVPNYWHGINFAVSGATARNITETVPFFLPLQTDHFIRFKRTVHASLHNKHKSECLVSHVPPLKSFKHGLYVIFIGANDILISLFLDGATPTQVTEKTVPPLISAITKAVQDLLREGAKNFMVFNILAIGCTPMVLTVASNGPFNSTDELGCLQEYNEVVQFSNLELLKALDILSHQNEDIDIKVADIYSFMVEAIAHPASYGFKESEKFKACCGHGDPYNYSPSVPCGGNPAAKACSVPSEYMSWDGLHLTDAFSKQFVEEMVKGMPYLKPATASVP